MDPNVLALHYHEVVQAKEALLSRCGVDKAELMSNDKFADLLRGLGVEPPMKVSITTGQQTYAFGAQFRVRPEPDFYAEVKALLGDAAIS